MMGSPKKLSDLLKMSKIGALNSTKVLHSKSPIFARVFFHS
jgi:hypothetical protein